MCGTRPCRSCARKKRKSRIGAKKKKMARRKTISVKGIQSTAMDGVQIYGGIVAAKALVNNVPQLSDPLPAIGAQLLLSLVASSSRSAAAKNVAKGIAANAMGTALNALVPNLTSTLGISGPGAGGSFIAPGVTGRVGAYRNMPRIKVS